MSCERVIVGMSGGVDSSVAALLLLEQGYAVEGLFMKNWEEDDGTGEGAAAQDLADAHAVCARLGIRLHRINFSYEYWERVFSRCLDEYQAGRTPNPDVLCNKEIKFKAFLEHARALGADFIATGHYASIGRDGGACVMLKARDETKDQTYFLYTLGQAQLACLLFPLSNLTKSEVRTIARQARLVTSEKKDSTGLCFIGERRFRDFLARFLPAQPGDIVDSEDNRLGRHNGLMYYTLGQRQGLGIGGRQGRPEGAWYVVAKELNGNRLIAVQGHNHPLLFSQGLVAGQLHWVDGGPPRMPVRCTAKVRYRQRDQGCCLHEDHNGRLRAYFDAPQRAITPGQSVVFYQGTRCLGGGVIERSLDARQS
jgi:tRNA-uridine 2-sulfurtransferase